MQRPIVSSISAQAVTLAVDKPLRGSMLSAEVRWRIDKDEVSSIFTRMRCNLLGKTRCSICKQPFSVHCMLPRTKRVIVSVQQEHKSLSSFSSTAGTLLQRVMLRKNFREAFV